MTSFRNLEDSIHDSTAHRRNAVSKLKSLLSEINNCRGLLCELKGEITSFDKVSKVVRTTGTIVSVAGATMSAAALVGGFFTGGATWLLLPEIGTVASLSGTATRITCDITKLIKSKGFGERLTGIASKMKSLVKELEACMRPLQDTSSLIESCFHVDSGKAWHLLTTFLAKIPETSPNFKGLIGIFIMTLTLAVPCSSFDDVGFRLASETIKNIAIAAGVVGPLTLQVAKESLKSTPKIASSVVKTAGNVATTSAVKFATATIDATSVAGSPAANLATTVGKESAEAIAFGALAAGIGVVFAVVDITSLVKEFSEGNPTIDNIDVLNRSLDQLEEKIQEVLDCLQEQTELQTLQDVFDGNDVDESSDEEDEEIDIYDISPSTIRRLLENSNIEDNFLPSNADSAVNIVRDAINNEDLRSSDYMYIIGAIEVLVQRYSANIDFVENKHLNNHSAIKLHTVLGDFGLDWSKIEQFHRAFLNIYWPIRDYLRVTRGQCEGLCVIYRFRCKICGIWSEDTSYVGQTSNLARRLKEHEIGFKSCVGINPLGLNLKPLYVHAMTFHSAFVMQKKNPSLGHVFELYICQRLEEFSTKDSQHSRVRRSWEVYYQWLFKARCSEGGLSIR